MAKTTLQDVYTRFVALFGNSTPIRGMRELDAAIRAAGLDYDQVTNDWLRTLDDNWIVGRSPEPFADDRTNRAYRRFVEGLA